MAKYAICRYLIATIEVEADTPEEALELEQNSDAKVSITDDTYPLEWEWSTNPAWVIDEEGDTVLEEGGLW
jgi:hypothetical protein